MIQPGRRHFAASKRPVAACTGLAGPLIGVAVPDFDGAYPEERLAAARKALADGRPMGPAIALGRKA